MFGITKVKIWATVDEYGDIKQVSHEFPKMDEKEYCVPMTLTLGHSWLEGFYAWWANTRAWF